MFINCKFLEFQEFPICEVRLADVAKSEENVNSHTVFDDIATRTNIAAAVLLLFEIQASAYFLAK